MLLGVVATVVVMGIAFAPRILLHSRQPVVPVHFRIDREIANDIRIGTDKVQVLEYCKRRGWGCYDSDRTLTAVARAADKNIVLRTNVAITFEFDSAGKLVSFHSEDHYTGP